MANVKLDEQHLHDIAYAIRDKKGVSQGSSTPITKIAKSSNVTSLTSYTAYGNNLAEFSTVTIPGAKSIKVELTYQSESTNYDFVQIRAGAYSTASSFTGTTKYGGTTKNTTTLTFTGDTVSFYFKSDQSNGNYLGYYAVVTGLDENGNAVTEAPGETYRPCDMAAAIASISTGSSGGGGVGKVAFIKSTDGKSFNLAPYLASNDSFFLLIYVGKTYASATAMTVGCVATSLAEDMTCAYQMNKFNRGTYSGEAPYSALASSGTDGYKIAPFARGNSSSVGTCSYANRIYTNNNGVSTGDTAILIY